MNWIQYESALGAKYGRGCKLLLESYHAYCLEVGLPPLESTTMFAYLEDLHRRTSRIGVRRASNHVRRLFLDAGCADPLDTKANRALLNSLFAGAKSVRESPVLSSRAYHDLIDALPPTSKGLRDGAMMGLVYCGRLAARDIAALDPCHAVFSTAGLRAQLVRSPTRRVLTLRRHADPRYCPVALLERWFLHTGYSAPGFPVVCHTGRVTEKRLTRSGLTQALEIHMAALGLGGGLASLKGTAIVVAEQRGVDDATISAQWGCRDPRTLERWRMRGRVPSGNATLRLGF